MLSHPDIYIHNAELADMYKPALTAFSIILLVFRQCHQNLPEINLSEHIALSLLLATIYQGCDV